MRKLCAIYRNTHRQGMITPEAVPDNLFSADKALNQFYKYGRSIYTIELIHKLQQNEH